MLSIVLYHNHYNEEHLEEVKKIMQKRGTPTIRCFWDECNGIWFAVEGCHRLRAAKELGLIPVIKDISEQKTLTYQCNGEVITERLTEKWFETWYDEKYSNIILDFEDEE